MLSGNLTPDFIVEMKEEAEELLNTLGDEPIRQVAELKIAGYSNAEIAKEMDCGKRTVERRMMIIRQTWIEKRFDQ